jgi:hypothetical protein
MTIVRVSGQKVCQLGDEDSDYAADGSPCDFPASGAVQDVADDDGDIDPLLPLLWRATTEVTKRYRMTHDSSDDEAPLPPISK